MIEKYTFHELRKIFDDIILIPERLDGLDIVQLKELYFHLEQRKLALMPTVYARLDGEKGHRDYDNIPKHLEYCKANCFQFNTSVLDLEYWMAILNKKINNEPRQDFFNDRIFRDAESEHCFKALYENWLNENDLPLVALHYVFRKMSNKTPENVDETIGRLNRFTIVATQTNFANYWNSNYRPLHPKGLEFTFKKDGNVSLKTFDEMASTSIDAYHTRLNAIVNKL